MSLLFLVGCTFVVLRGLSVSVWSFVCFTGGLHFIVLLRFWHECWCFYDNCYDCNIKVFPFSFVFILLLLLIALLFYSLVLFTRVQVLGVTGC